MPFCCDYETKPDLILFGGNVITCNPEGEPDVAPTAVAVAKGYILAIGSDNSILKMSCPDTRVVNLKGNTLTPGFIDPHSHFNNALMMRSWCNLSPTPVGPVTSLAVLVQVLKEHANKPELSRNKFVFGYGYDQNYLGLEGNRHLTCQDLDVHFPDVGVVVVHNSHHGVICNTQALQQLGISQDVKNPEGGHYSRTSAGELSGGLWDKAFIDNVEAIFHDPNSVETQTERFIGIHDVQMRYVANGYTTCQEGFSDSAICHNLLEAAKDKRLFIDVIALPGFRELDNHLQDFTFNQYFNKLKFGGVKIVMDGSPQAETAWLTTPTENGVNGEPTIDTVLLDELVKKTIDNDIQVYCHCNGDASIDAYLNALERAGVKEGDENRHVVVHSQIVRKDQLESYKKYGIVPSFFTNHCFYHGDTHRKNLGKARASYMNPCGSAQKLGIKYTNHTDFTMTPLDPMFTMWTAVSRTTRSGIPLGIEERITSHEALMAITYNAAYQYHEEELKGSIEEGKLADMVVISKNPCTVEVDKIKDIKIQMTFKDGVEVFNRKKHDVEK